MRYVVQLRLGGGAAVVDRRTGEVVAQFGRVKAAVSYARGANVAAKVGRR